MSKGKSEAEFLAALRETRNGWGLTPRGMIRRRRDCPITALCRDRGLGVFAVGRACRAAEVLGLDYATTWRIVGASDKPAASTLRTQLLEAVGLETKP